MSSTVNTAHRLSSPPNDGIRQAAEPACHPVLPGGTIKHIPKAARTTCSTKLSDLLDRAASNLDDPQVWMDLLYFGPTILIKQPRSGKRHNLSNAIKKRCASDICSRIGARAIKNKVQAGTQTPLWQRPFRRK